MADSPSKAEDGPRRKAGYKSWKKKYRKMRIAFEHQMHVGEEIFKQEAKASATVKRLAEENDRLLDLLLDINNCPQIPTEKRVDVSLSSSSETFGIKRLEDMVKDVPHMTYAAVKESNPSLIADLEKAEKDAYPAHFLSPDDVDNYIHLIDAKLDPENHIPTLAPLAHPNDHPPLHPLLRNPNSSTSWLRRHAPQIFLQGHEGESHAADGAAAGEDETSHQSGAGHASARKSRGGSKAGERGTKSGARGKRPSVAARSTPSAATDKDKPTDWDASIDDDGDLRSTPVPTKNKRKRDDDPGYRPKGGSGSRPSKKKRKSEGGADSTPTVKKSTKEVAVAAAD